MPLQNVWRASEAVFFNSMCLLAHSGGPRSLTVAQFFYRFGMSQNR